MDSPGKVSKKRVRLTKDGLNINSRKAKKLKEIKRLEKIIFGDPETVVGDRKQKAKNAEPKSDIDEESGEESNYPKKKLQKKPAWDDEDDEESIQVALQLQGRLGINHPGKPTDAYTGLLKKKFESIIGTPSWAQLTTNKVSTDDVDLLQRCGNLIESSTTLEMNHIKFKPVKDLNYSTMCEGPVIKAVEFHPSSSIGLVAGLSGIVSLFEVNGKVNAKVQSIKFEKFNVSCAKFSHDGDQFIVGSEHHKDYYSHDLIEGRTVKHKVHRATNMTNMRRFEVSPDGRFIAVCGSFGNIFLLSGKSKEWIDTLKMNDNVQAICFTSDGSKLYSHGDGGHVYVWDMKSRRCTHKFYDEGSLKGTSLAVSPDDAMIACGSSSGVVNVYDVKKAVAVATPAPLNVFFNLTTEVTSLKFNHTSELLAMSSIKQPNSFKLAHFPSMTVYSNFPTNTTNYGLIQSVSFSPNSKYLAAGSNKWKALLFRLKHFQKF